MKMPAVTTGGAHPTSFCSHVRLQPAEEIISCPNHHFWGHDWTRPARSGFNSDDWLTGHLARPCAHRQGSRYGRDYGIPQGMLLQAARPERHSIDEPIVGLVVPTLEA